MAFTRENNPEFFKEIDKAFLIPEVGLSVHRRDKRIIVAGTNNELRFLRSQLELETIKNKYIYASHINRFWSQFFNSSDFSLEEMSIPERMISTGFIRSSVYFNETVEVKDNLVEISKHFGIPVEFIHPTHI